MTTTPEVSTSGWAHYWAPNRGMQLATDHSFALSLSIALYLPIVWTIQFFMRDRPPFKLKWFAFFWNLALSVFSAIGVVMLCMDNPMIVFRTFVQEPTYMVNTRSVIALFSLTKPVEFGDTFILAMKKKPIIFLHLYHHVTVAAYCLHAQAQNVQFAHPFAAMNLVIHSGMYLYYAAAVVIPRHPILRALRPYITKSQTLQMMVGMYIAMNAIYKAEEGNLSDGQLSNAWWSLTMYFTYVYLFGKFYLENYVKGVRPVMTLVIGTIHILSIVGFALLWKHPSARMIVLEMTVCYVTSVVLLRLANRLDPYAFHKWDIPGKKRTTRSASTAADSDEVRSPLSNSSSPVKRKSHSSENKNAGGSGINISAADEGGKSESEGSLNSQFARKLGKFSEASAVARVSRVGLMVLNTWSTWAREHRFWKLQDDLHQSEISDQDTSPRSENGGESPSLLKTLVKNADDKRSGDVIGLPFRPSDYALAALCVVAPALYGLYAHGDVVVGVCVHGCLRWILELHTTDALVPDMKIAKFG